jgi:hypothetical protein
MAWDWDKILGGVASAATGGLFGLAQPLISYALGAYDHPDQPKYGQMQQQQGFVPLSQAPQVQIPGVQSIQQPQVQPLPMYSLQSGLPPLPSSNPWAAQPGPQYTPPPSPGLMNLTRYFS